MTDPHIGSDLDEFLKEEDMVSFFEYAKDGLSPSLLVFLIPVYFSLTFFAATFRTKLCF
jgi:hypothetical protein